MTLKFAVRRREPELICPAGPTPREVKLLSDIDDQEGLRFQIPSIQFYRGDDRRRGENPAAVIREALAKVLVYYYPFAGRLREGPNRKLMVDCTAEGVIFIEAEADVTLKEFGDDLQPPFPCMEELLFDVPGSSDILHSPLVLIQFMMGLGEMAQGAGAPSIMPVWQRELLLARDPPRVTCTHPEYEQVPDTKGTLKPFDDMVQRSFFFGPSEVSALRRFISERLGKCSTFEVLTACLWRCRTIALQPEPDELMRIICIVSARPRFNPPLPVGYYGNAFAFPVAISKAGDLCKKPLGHALELVMKAKSDVTEEYMRSTADLMVTTGRIHFTVVRSYLVSDVTRAGFLDIDFGWGKPTYGGNAHCGVGPFPGLASFYIPFKNKKGETGIVVPLYLPRPAMERFVAELDTMLKGNTGDQAIKSNKFITSAL